MQYGPHRPAPPLTRLPARPLVAVMHNTRITVVVAAFAIVCYAIFGEAAGPAQ